MGVDSEIIVNGFEEDCKQLIVRFEKESCAQFGVFVSIWKDMNFSLIFAGRKAKESILLATQVLALLKSFFIHSKSFLRKVCSVFIMHGIYYRQPYSEHAKIRVTIAEWKQILDFMGVVKKNKHVDVHFVLMKLIANNAFDLSISEVRRMHFKEVHKYTEDIAMMPPTFEDFEIEQLIENLQSIEDEYDRSKIALAESRNQNKVDYCETEVTKYLQYIISKEEVEEEEEEKHEVDNVEPSTSKSPPEKTIGSKRQAIRDKFFTQINESTIFRSVCD